MELIIGVTEAQAYVEQHQVLFKNDTHAFAFQTSKLGTLISGGRRLLLEQVVHRLVHIYLMFL